MRDVHRNDQKCNGYNNTTNWLKSTCKNNKKKKVKNESELKTTSYGSIKYKSTTTNGNQIYRSIPSK